jgi:hypothetical protein
MGLGDKLKGNLEPWLCYYCGDCSDQCPREAEPGETMMSMRRWLTSKYDITGLSTLFYQSKAAEILSILALALLTGFGFYGLGMTKGGGDFGSYPDGLIPSHSVDPWTGLGLDIKSIVFVMGIGLIGLLAVNLLRMWWFTTGSKKDLSVPFGTYLKHVFVFPYQLFTQKRYSECDKKRPWAVHLILMLSFVALFLVFLVHVLVPGNASIHTLLGPLASIAMIGATAYMINGRLNKTETHNKYSHHSDTNFLYMCLYVGATGLLQHFAGRFGSGAFANFVYILHMMGAVPMLVIQLPFTKWAHFVYRPYAMYLAAVQADVIAEREGAKDAAAALVPQKQIA